MVQADPKKPQISVFKSFGQFRSPTRRATSRIRKSWWSFLNSVFDGSIKIAAGLVLTGSLQNTALANPQGGSVVEGSVRIEQS